MQLTYFNNKYLGLYLSYTSLLNVHNLPVTNLIIHSSGLDRIFFNLHSSWIFGQNKCTGYYFENVFKSTPILNNYLRIYFKSISVHCAKPGCGSTRRPNLKIRLPGALPYYSKLKHFYMRTLEIISEVEARFQRKGLFLTPIIICEV